MVQPLEPSVETIDEIADGKSFQAKTGECERVGIVVELAGEPTELLHIDQTPIGSAGSKNVFEQDLHGDGRFQ